MVEKIYEKLGLDYKVEKYAKDIKRLKTEYKEFYDYFNSTFNHIHDIKKKSVFEKEIKRVYSEVELFKVIDRGVYNTLTHLMNNIVNVKLINFEKEMIRCEDTVNI